MPVRKLRIGFIIFEKINTNANASDVFIVVSVLLCQPGIETFEELLSFPLHFLMKLCCYGSRDLLY